MQTATLNGSFSREKDRHSDSHVYTDALNKREWLEMHTHLPHRLSTSSEKTEGAPLAQNTFCVRMRAEHVRAYISLSTNCLKREDYT